ncbi:acyl-CoA N-acyltransferases (NAT) superfamily protein [Tasmannia lanceolata]|uniref:acyl-CoA N-acyltransferases (NAT) superfamily protein n=1 Tax=Tasmannia lanceolata TaxID=3420 RepID=UPI004063B6E5
MGSLKILVITFLVKSLFILFCLFLQCHGYKNQLQVAETNSKILNNFSLAPKSDFWRISTRGKCPNRGKFHRIPISVSMTNDLASSHPWKKEDNSAELQMPSVAQPDVSRLSDLRFDRLQPSVRECEYRHKRMFGCFVAREAILDEEYWTAAWLRAESHWEDRSSDRYADSYKRKFAEQEFNALKRRCSGQLAEKSTCIVTAKKEENNVKRTVLKSIVGTLDISIRNLLQGETFPGEHTKASVFSRINRKDGQRYLYVSNLCVAKFARRQGIASNMLHLAIEAAKSSGIDQILVHVHKDNVSAQQLYTKIGFETVEMATDHLLAEENYLLNLRIS